MERASSSIRTLTESCLSKFEQLLALQNPRHVEILESRLADFSLWADGLGALAKPGASLDSRLGGRPNDIELVRNILSMLAASLDYYAGLAETEADCDGGIQNLDSAIKNLALIGVAIRRTGKASRNRKADQTFDPDEHQELRKYLECVVLLRPTEDAQFRLAGDGRYVTKLDASELSDLQKRLIEANLRRRHNFSLAHKRSGTQGKTQKQDLAPTFLSWADIAQQRKVPHRAQRAADLQPRQYPNAKAKESRAPTISGLSLASTAEGTLQYALGAKEYTPKMAKTQITFIASDAEFPRAPSIPFGREISKCPCCCQSLPVEIFRNPETWKQHIIEDLCPYTCVAENCPTPQLLFRTRNEWESHVRNKHLPRWQCPFCEGEDADCPTMERMESHFRSDHKDEFVGNSLSTLLSWSAIQTMGIKSCPLCSSCRPEDSPELVDHVLRHAYEFALRALPWPWPAVHDLNALPGHFSLPEDPEAAENLQRWIDEAAHESAEPALELCDHDRADHSSAPINHSEYSHYLFTNGYFDDRPEDKSSRSQGNHTINSSYARLLLADTNSDIDTKGDRDDDRNTLSQSAENEHEAIVRSPIDQLFMVDTMNESRRLKESLLQAAENGHTSLVQRLINEALKVDASSPDGRTSLSLAAEHGHEAIVLLLIGKGAEIDAVDYAGRTALSWSAENGHEAVVRLLIDKGAEVNSKDYLGGQIPLSHAAQNGHEAVVRLLIDKGADANATDRFGSWTALSKAAVNGHEAVVGILIDRGAKFSWGEEFNRTALSRAAENGHEAIVRLLLRKGANIDVEDYASRTALSWGAENGHEAVVRLLIENGAEVDSRDEFDRTALSRAVEHGHNTVARLLIDSGADVNARNRGGRTALSWAAENGHESVVQLLIDNGADVDAKSADDQTPFRWAPKYENEAMVWVINKDEGDPGGRTALLWAAKNGHEAVVRLLINNGANSDTEDSSGRTAFEWATNNGHEAVVRLLNPRRHMKQY